MRMGLDLSCTATGIVVIDDLGKVVDSVTVGAKLKRTSSVKQKIERLTMITAKLMGMIKEHGVTSVGIEGYAYGARGAQNDLGELHGVVKTQIYLGFRIVPDIIAVSRARKLVFGKGNLKKDKVLDELTKRGYKVSDQDQGDALVIALAMRRLEQCQS